ncbi:GNAT family N-acetyltransferase [Zobellella denitrificans]|uniref:GNAT family N-acetyltransferase n=1 Tax=Zobellella denitrificans TaxID=347534 RepID=UPI000B8C0CD6|nr:GNAT family N-acetyltransferase [Zobellella denitrificans]OXS17157.1 GNAT family N-acetyltransferase [Zobellella denitrificans]
MEIRKIRSGETGSIWRLFHDTVHRINQADYSKSELAVWAPDEYDEPRWVSRFIRTRPLVAMDGKSLLGFAELSDDGRIDLFYVHHARQGEGIGRALMQRLKAEASSRGLSRLHCEASITARPFFEAMGFVALEQRQLERRGQPVPVILMEYRA